MANFFSSQIGKQARVLTAALVLGTAILTLSTGQTAYAIRAPSSDSGGSDSGDGPAIGTAARPKRPADNGIRCTNTLPDGHIDFYLEGDVIWSNGRMLICRANGWQIVRSGSPSSVGGPTSGAYTQMP
jgi:hypothetical protein